MNNQINERVNAGIDYVLIVLLLLTNNAMYAIGYTALSNVRIQAIIVALYLPITYISLKNTKGTNYLKLFLIIAGSIIFFMIYLGATHDNSILSKKAWLTFFLFIPTMCVYFFSRAVNDTLDIFFERGIRLVSILAIFSLFCWTIFSLFHIFPGKIFYSTWSGANIKSFFGVYFETQQQRIINMNIPRNTSIYPEAPMYAYVLATTLVWNVFLVKRMSKSANYILGITLLTTFSSTGITALLFILMGLIIRWGAKYVKSRTKFYGMIIGIVLIGGVILMKMLSAKTQSMSYIIRQDDIHSGILSWIKSPFFGNGYQNELAITSEMVSWRHVQSDIHLIGYSSGLFTILSNGGIYLLIFYVGPIILNCIQLVRGKIIKSIWLIFGMFIMIFMLLFSIVPYTAFTFTTIIAFYIITIFPDYDRKK